MTYLILHHVLTEEGNSYWEPLTERDVNWTNGTTRVLGFSSKSKAQRFRSQLLSGRPRSWLKAYKVGEAAEFVILDPDPNSSITNPCRPRCPV